MNVLFKQGRVEPAWFQFHAFDYHLVEPIEYDGICRFRTADLAVTGCPAVAGDAKLVDRNGAFELADKPQG